MHYTRGNLLPLGRRFYVMEKIIKILQLLTLLTILGLSIWYFFFRKVTSPDPVVVYEYVTDTIFVSVPYEVPKPYPTPTPPITITVYEIDSLALDSFQILIREKDMVISKLRDSIFISQNFLKQFPSNPKLIGMGLNKDTLSLALLQISGQVEDKAWPINLNQFAYRWDHVSDLSRHPTQLPPTKEKVTPEYFVGGGADLLFISPYLSGSVEWDYSRIRLYGDIQLGLLKREASSIRLGIDYRVHGKSSIRNR